ncbi:helix-turn-helix transcriptional regulator [Pseudoxanthomonas sp. CF125]|uniref:helix-turn-helix domain-containing protein n=1 Tax=Pseudoxanthomonas sp. CF125 TaxID=1855303 RepID=UPI000887D254|nr:helix-turn-helix transcriptional regulator [Pseudoxanthomonas sp. CF125]SDQ35101.1 Helix-turn-helix [Pseudoxanthomonas sp. CF125]
MSFRSWRERKLLSQERVAEMSGLSLRTVQRLEAGHRVSYASLRALAAAFETDVDLLERELYAMNKPTDDFVEIPRWVRLMNDRLWFGGPRLSRQDMRLIEALCIGCAVIVFAASFLVASDAAANRIRTGAVIALVAGYLVSAFLRIHDRYKLWPGSGSVPSEPRPRTWRSVAAEYALFLVAAILGVAMMSWLVL